jgi:hypothetical protein
LIGGIKRNYLERQEKATVGALILQQFFMKNDQIITIVVIHSLGITK